MTLTLTRSFDSEQGEIRWDVLGDGGLLAAVTR